MNVFVNINHNNGVASNNGIYCDTHIHIYHPHIIAI